MLVTIIILLSFSQSEILILTPSDSQASALLTFIYLSGRTFDGYIFGRKVGACRLETRV